MRIFGKVRKYLFLLLYLFIAGCAVMEGQGKKTVPLGLITTPATYYSTPKAKYLGERYQSHLDKIVEQITRNPKTANLQFANNISSIGGIGFFTHSAVRSADERYLEVILVAPETFEAPGEFNAKFERIFSLYGTELLSLLSDDLVIYQEKEVSGYGLNVSWRNIVSDRRGPRVTLERAIVYFPKEKVRSFLTRELSRNDLLEHAVIFSVREDGAPTLVSFRAPEPRQDFRPPILEENLAAAKAVPQRKAETPSRSTTLHSPAAPLPPVPARQKHSPRAEPAPKPTLPTNKEQLSPSIPPPPTRAAKEEPKRALPVPAAVQQATGGSQVAIVEAKRPELTPKEQAKTKAETMAPQTGAETEERSAVAVKSPESTSIATKQDERAESKDSGHQLRADMGSSDVNKFERPAVLPDRAESVEVTRTEAAAAASRAEVAAAPPREKAAATSPRDGDEAPAVPPVGTSMKLVEAPAPAPVTTPKTHEIEPSQAGLHEAPRRAETRAVAPPAEEPTISSGSNEQVALLRRPPSEPAIDKKPPVRPLPKALEGFVIQVGFSERVKAQRWAESMERAGYAVSITESGAGAVRVRIGNFAMRDEAEHRLQNFRKEGLTGIVINLPQAFRPQVAESKSE